MPNLCSPLLDNVKQVGMIVESTCGQGGTFTSADFKIRPSSVSVTTDMSPKDDDTLSASLSPKKSTMGEKKASVKLAGKLVGSGIATTKPEIDVALIGCGMKSEVVMVTTIGTITVGAAFIPGEIITQAVSLATGQVMKETKVGETKLYFVVRSGTWVASGVITGSVSTSVATGSTLPVAAGFAYSPKTVGVSTIALKVEEDGRQKTILGAMGSWVVSADSSGPAKIEFSFNGVKGVYGDQALTSGVTYYSSTYPVFIDSRCALDRSIVAGLTPVVRSISVDYQGDSTVRKDANQTTGLIAAKQTKRQPQMTITAEALLAATYDIYAKMAACATVTAGFQFTAPDNNVWIWGTNGQITASPEGAADGFSTTDITLRMCGISGDDEIWIVFTT
jgi:hypothetical protein